MIVFLKIKVRQCDKRFKVFMAIYLYKVKTDDENNFVLFLCEFIVQNLRHIEISIKIIIIFLLQLNKSHMLWLASNYD